MKQRLLLPMLVALVGFCSPAAAQQPALPAPPPQAGLPAPNASDTREALQVILELYPYTVAEVLRRDPSLMARPDYMATYPQLAKFLEQHPEVPRNVEYYFEGFGGWQPRRPLNPNFEALGVLLGGMAGVFAVTLFMGVFVWLARAIIQHRRWLKSSQVQADVHTKLMERMSTNDELLAYVQSPAGRRFLEAAPIKPESDAAAGSAPIGSIIWSMMAGVVLTTVGIGFRYAANFITDESNQAFIVVGVIILALGIGFMAASLMAYLVSSRLGLFPQRQSAAESQSGNA